VYLEIKRGIVHEKNKQLGFHFSFKRRKNEKCEGNLMGHDGRKNRDCGVWF